VSLRLPARKRFQDGTYCWGLATNIGSGGIFIETATRPSRNRCVDVHLTIPSSVRRRSTILIPALVVHRTEKGVGLMFRELDQKAQEAIAGLLNANNELVQPARVTSCSEAGPSGAPDGYGLARLRSL
jgi:hypothetical protein